LRRARLRERADERNGGKTSSPFGGLQLMGNKGVEGERSVKWVGMVGVEWERSDEMEKRNRVKRKKRSKQCPR